MVAGGQSSVLGSPLQGAGSCLLHRQISLKAAHAARKTASPCPACPRGRVKGRRRGAMENQPHETSRTGLAAPSTLLRGVPRGGPCREEGGSWIHPPLRQPNKPLPAPHISIPYSGAGAEDDPGAAIAPDVSVVVAMVLGERRWRPPLETTAQGWAATNPPCTAQNNTHFAFPSQASGVPLHRGTGGMEPGGCWLWRFSQGHRQPHAQLGSLEG